MVGAGGHRCRHRCRQAPGRLSKHGTIAVGYTGALNDWRPASPSCDSFSVRQPIPDVLMLPAGGTLRFALGSADGSRSNVWSVVGHKNTDDIYIGARQVMSAAKLSLHESGVWRRALTSQEAERLNLAEDRDRVLNRWEVPEPFGEGWIYAVTISIPQSSIQANPGPLKSPRKGSISFYLPEASTHTVRFDVLIKSDGAPSCEIRDIHAHVGRIALPSGGCVHVFASEFDAVDERAEADIENLRQKSRELIISQMGLDGFAEYERPVGSGWGFSNDDGRPTIIDLGSLKR
jgi:hypothetical protein